MKIAYRGTDFHGWQRQPNATTVQEVLEKGLATLLRTPTPIVGSGRTDAGVHATAQWAHLDTEQPLDAAFIRQLNGWLPDSIAVLDLCAVSPEFGPNSHPTTTDAILEPAPHARYGAQSRAYEYHFVGGKDPFRVGRAWWVKPAPDWSRMQEAAQRLFDYRDFASFCKAHGNNKTTLCEIRSVDLTPTPNGWVFEIRANRFLRGMVRAIVGTLVDIGHGKLSCDDFSRIIEARDRAAASAAAPPDGLYLVDVAYPPGLLTSILPVAVAATPAGPAA